MRNPIPAFKGTHGLLLLWTTIHLVTITTLQAQESLSNTAIEGQVYVARADRETVKLSAVTIHIVDTSAAKAVVAKVEQLKRKADEVDARDTELRKNYKALFARLPTMKPEDKDSAVKSLEAIRSLIVSNSAHFDRKLWLSSYAKALRNSEWPSVRKVETDTDGNFRVQMPKGDWTIVAMAQRRISTDKDEEYLWILPAHPGEKTILNNNNLYDEERR